MKINKLFLNLKILASKQERFSHTLSFLSCLEYGNTGMTAVTRDAEAILQALIIIKSSIRLSFICPQPLCMINTSSPLTDSPISTLSYLKMFLKSFKIIFF